MEKQKKLDKDETVFIGIDLHKRTWHVTIRTFDIELFSGGIPGFWENLKPLLKRYSGHEICVVYEAGLFGFWLHDKLVDCGVQCSVTPPSLIPIEYGNKVKTDRRDSRKLASFLAKGLLRSIYVPSLQERYHRQVIRRRRQLIRDRVRTQNRIKSELQFNGLNLSAPHGKWTQAYYVNLCKIKFPDRWMQESFNRLLEQYDFLCDLVDKQTQLLKELSEKKLYKNRVKILQSIPGVGLIASMEMLLELQDIKRFRRADQLAAYVGLTPSQYSSADKIRMGRITCIGKNSVRAILVQASWCLIRKDGVMRERYEKIKARAGGKRAIVAIARQLLIRMRRILLDGTQYVPGVMATTG
jgi:transposase